MFTETRLIRLGSAWKGSTAFLFAEEEKESRGLFAVLLVLMLAVCAARCYAGLFGILAYPHDVFALVDPAWRILHHQTPHMNFYSNIGPVPFLETAAGLLLSRGGIEGLIYGQVIAGFLTAVWIYFVARIRIPQALVCLLTFYVLLLAIAPFNVGESFSVISAAMTYNRLCYALTAIVLVEAVTGRETGQTSGFAYGTSTGAALGLLLFTKVTFFFGAGLLIAVFGVLYPKSKSRWVGFAVGFGVTALTFLAFLGFHITAILRDYRITALAKHLGPAKIFGALLEVSSGEAISMAAFVCLCCLVLRDERGRGVIRKLATAGVVALGSGVFLLIGNFQGRGLPLNACFALVVAGLLLRGQQLKKSGFFAFRNTLVIWAVLMAAGPIVMGMAGICYAAMERAVGKIPVMKSQGLAMFRIRDKGYSNFVDDGLLLASRHRKADDQIASLDFSDFYSYALRMNPAEGGASCLHFGSTFSDASHPTPERLMGGASIVMVPVIYSEEGSQLSIPRIYGPYLTAHFHLDSSSQQWHLYRRNL